MSTGAVLWLWMGFSGNQERHPSAGAQTSSPLSPPVVTASVPLAIPSGTGPVSVASGGGSVWVGSAGSCSGRLSQIDPGTGQVVDTIPIDVVSSISYGAGAVWVAGATCANGSEQSAVFRIDPKTHQIMATVPLGCDAETSSGGCHSSDIAAGTEAVWVTLDKEAGSGEILSIDAATNEIATRTSVQGWPRDVAVGGTGVWVYDLSDFSGNDVVGASLLKINPTSGAVVDTLFAGSLASRAGVEVPPAFSAPSDAVWVQESDGSVSEVNPSTDTRVAPPTPYDGPFWPILRTTAEFGLWAGAEHPGRIGASPTLTRLPTRLTQASPSMSRQ
jgi:hypothetical protein